MCLTQKLTKVQIYKCAICIDTYFIGHTMAEMMATKYIYVSFRQTYMSLKHCTLRESRSEAL